MKTLKKGIIVKIERIQNKQLWDTYQLYVFVLRILALVTLMLLVINLEFVCIHTFLSVCALRKKSHMKNNNRGCDVTEKKLFHGTDNKHVDVICHSNFDWRLCGVHGTSYGKGELTKKLTFEITLQKFICWS